MDNISEPESTADEEARLEAAIRESIGELERAKDQMSEEQLEIERLKVETRAISENEGKRDLMKVSSGDLPQKGVAPELVTTDTIYHEIVDQRRGQRRALWLTLIGILIGVISILVTVRPQLVGLRSGVQSAKTQILLDQTNQFIITTPRNGADVSFTDLISGRTPFPASMNHYVVVTTRQGVDWVQDTPATVASGTFTGSARFGEADTPSGESYIIRVLTTESTLNAGPLHKMPEDAVFSEPVTVRRK